MKLRHHRRHHDSHLVCFLLLLNHRHHPQGTLQKTGYCRGADCQTFPVVPGEIGSAFTNPLDSAYYRDLATFMKRQPPADRYESVAFGHYFWWW